VPWLDDSARIAALAGWRMRLNAIEGETPVNTVLL